MTQKRVDSNAPAIVRALRDVGASVRSTAMVGQGFPDLAVGAPLPCPFCRSRFAQNVLLEIKDGSKPPSARALTIAEEEFHDSWRGHVVIVSSIDEALRVAGVQVA